jgi:hypothetical protein
MAAREASASTAAKACLTALFSQDTVRTIMIAQMEGTGSADAQTSLSAIGTKTAACRSKK